MEREIDVHASPSRNHVSIPDLVEGVCVDFLFVKVEKLIMKQVMRYPLGKLGPVQSNDQLHLVVFDKCVQLKLYFSCIVIDFIFAFFSATSFLTLFHCTSVSSTSVGG